jgi:hypothetical protein
MYTEAQWKELGERFNKQSFLSKLVTIKNNPTIFYVETDGFNIRLRLVDEAAMKAGYDEYFSFPEFFEYSHLRDIFSLNDIKIKELK